MFRLYLNSNKLKNIIYRNFPKIIFFLKKIIPTKDNLPKWEKIISFNKLNYNEKLKKIKKKNTKSTIIITSAGAQKVLNVYHSILAFGLTLKNTKTEFMICDKVLNACQMCTSNIINEKELIKKGPEKICDNCFSIGKKIFSGLDLTINKFSEFINDKEKVDCINYARNIPIENIKNLKIDEIPIGEQVIAGCLRYFGVGNLDLKNKKNQGVILKYLESAIITKKIFENFFKKKDIDRIIIDHAI